MDIGESFQNAMDRLVGFLPNLLAFLVILLVGYIISRIVAAVIGKVLAKVGLDRRLQESSSHNYVDRVMPGASASRGIARAVFWLVFLFFLSLAIGSLGIPAATVFIGQLLGYLPNVIAAIVIFVIAAILAGVVARASSRLMAGSPTGKIVSTVLPALVMVIALFMILQQLQIAPPIVQIAFAATMGALALGLALAFGLGGRPVAQRLLEEAYESNRRVRLHGSGQPGYVEGTESVDLTGRPGDMSTHSRGVGETRSP